MTKSEKTIREYILNVKSFTWATDVVDHTLWGFKGAPYKTFNRAISMVKTVISKMDNEGLIKIEKGIEGSQPIIHLA